MTKLYTCVFLCLCLLPNSNFPFSISSVWGIYINHDFGIEAIHKLKIECTPTPAKTQLELRYSNSITHTHTIEFVVSRRCHANKARVCFVVFAFEIGISDQRIKLPNRDAFSIGIYALIFAVLVLHYAISM